MQWFAAWGERLGGLHLPSCLTGLALCFLDNHSSVSLPHPELFRFLGNPSWVFSIIFICLLPGSHFNHHLGRSCVQMSRPDLLSCTDEPGIQVSKHGPVSAWHLVSPFHSRMKSVSISQNAWLLSNMFRYVGSVAWCYGSDYIWAFRIVILRLHFFSLTGVSVLLHAVWERAATCSFPFQFGVNVHSEAFRLSSEQSLSWALGWWLVTTWNGEGKSRGQMDEKQLETVVESYRHESMRNESKNMTKVWHSIPQNTPEVLNCVCLGNSAPKQNVFSCSSLSRRKDYHTYTWTEWKQWRLSVKANISLSEDWWRFLLTWGQHWLAVL